MVVAGLALLAAALPCMAEGKKPQKAPEAAPDVLVLSNGDTLHGTLVSAMHGTVKFHSAVLGDVSLPWSKVKELRTADSFAVVDRKDKLLNAQKLAQIPAGPLEVTNQTLTLHPASGTAPAPIPVKQAAYVLSQKTVTEMMQHKQGFLTG